MKRIGTVTVAIELNGVVSAFQVRFKAKVKTALEEGWTSQYLKDRLRDEILTWPACDVEFLNVRG